jgi:hypothetical protein
MVPSLFIENRDAVRLFEIKHPWPATAGNGLGFGQADEDGGKMRLTAACVGLFKKVVGLVAVIGKAGL